MKERMNDAAPRGELRADAVVHGTEESSEARGLSQTIRDPTRRKRSASRKTKDRIRPNGPGGESSSLTKRLNGATTNGKGKSREILGPNSAASDDAGGTAFAEDAAQPSAAVCTGREAYAEVADSPSDARHGGHAEPGEAGGNMDDRRPRAPGDVKTDDLKTMNKANGAAPESATVQEECFPGTNDPLAFDAPGFVEEMHARVNLYAIGKALLEAGDLKIKQRAWEYLLEMKYGRGAPTSPEEAPRVDVEFPKPQ